MRSAIAHRSDQVVPFVAAELPDDHLEPGSAVVTVWTEDDDARSWSVSVSEPHTNIVFTGWSSQAIGQELAESFVALVNQAESTMILSSSGGRGRATAPRFVDLRHGGGEE